MDKKSVSITEAQQMVDDWIKTIGVRYFSELTNMTILTEEVGELARHFARQFGDQSYRVSETPPISGEAGRGLIADEMADVLWVLICLANQTGIDLTEALQNSIQKKTIRDFNRHKDNPKLI